MTSEVRRFCNCGWSGAEEHQYKALGKNSKGLTKDEIKKVFTLELVCLLAHHLRDCR
jgi:hypothetical protein